MDVLKCMNKIKLILENIFEEKIVLNENDAEKLLSFLEDRKENSLGKQILDRPDFSDFIYHSLEKINNASTPVQVFLLEIVTVLFKNELQFSKMHMQGFRELFNEFCMSSNLSRSGSSLPPPNLYLACIHLATAKMSHCSGSLIIIQNKVWKKILHTNVHHQLKSISVASYDFIANLVWKLNEYDRETELREVLGYILEPILTSGYLNVSVLDTEADAALADAIFSHLSALLVVMREGDNYTPVNKVMTILREHYLIDPRFIKILYATKNQNLLKLLNTVLFRYFFQTYRHLLFSNNAQEFGNKMVVSYCNVIIISIKKREPFALVDLAIQSNIILSHFQKLNANKLNFPITFERNGKTIDFSIQIFAHLLVPIMKYLRLHYIMNKLAMTDAVEEFLDKMARTITDYIYTSAFFFGELLEAGNPPFIKKVTIHTLKELLRLKGHLNEGQAGILFRSLYYLLEIFILSDGAGGLVMNESPTEPDDLVMLSHLLNLLKMLLTEHCISWRQNLEVINIQANLLNLLKQSFLTSKHLVQVIDLINICVKRFLSPNMSLLVEDKSTQGSTLNEMGEVIKLYMQHEEWEVRDSSLNLLNSCTEICFIKYVPLQKVISNKNLIVIAAKVALTDVEFYSQTTALKCLTAAIKIDSIWQAVLLDNPHIYLQLIHIIRNHGEGMVRREAVNVLKEVYVNKKHAPSLMSPLYEIMLIAALDDLHWEVQLAALNFWQSVIKNHLTDRGMIDGKFPLVTFSKEKRKIIKLNSAEIQRQLDGIMDDLSSIGCFTALLGCLDEIHNVDVMDKAYRIAKEFTDMLEKHKYEIVIKGERTSFDEDLRLPGCVETHITNLSDLSSEINEEERNKVINNILCTDLSDLIINLHDNYNEIKSEDMDENFSYFPKRDFVDKDNFLKMVWNNDYALVIERKKNFYTESSTLERFLDELLDLPMVT